MKRLGFSSSLGRKKASFPYILRVGRMFIFPASVFVRGHIHFFYVTAVCKGCLYLRVCAVLSLVFNGKGQVQYHRKPHVFSCSMRILFFRFRFLLIQNTST